MTMDKRDIRLNDYMVLKHPETAKEQIEILRYQAIHHKISHILEDRKLSRGEMADRIADLVIKEIRK